MPWPRPSAPARRSSSARARCSREGGFADFSATHVEVLGAEASYGPHARARAGREVMLRVVADHADRRALELFAREIAPAGTSWSPGTTGAGGGRPRVAPLVGRSPSCSTSAPSTASFTLADASRSARVPLVRRHRADGRARRARPPFVAERGDEASETRAAGPPCLGAQRRQGQRLEHRRRRAPRRVAAAALGRAHARARQGLARPSRRRRGRALPPARHRRDQLRAPRGARRRRHRRRTGSIRSARAWRSCCSRCRSTCRYRSRATPRRSPPRRCAKARSRRHGARNVGKVAGSDCAPSAPETNITRGPTWQARNPA